MSSPSLNKKRSEDEVEPATTSSDSKRLKTLPSQVTPLSESTKPRVATNAAQPELQEGTDAVATTVKIKKETVYELKVTLKRRPPVWRKIQVVGSTTLQQLHLILQQAMGWDNDHLHLWTIDDEDYGPGGFGALPEKTVTLYHVVNGLKHKFLYEYDRNWRHEVVVEKILPSVPGKIYPVCISGKEPCPPEYEGNDVQPFTVDEANRKLQEIPTLIAQPRTVFWE